MKRRKHSPAASVSVATTFTLAGKPFERKSVIDYATTIPVQPQASVPVYLDSFQRTSFEYQPWLREVLYVDVVLYLRSDWL